MCLIPALKILTSPKRSKCLFKVTIRRIDSFDPAFKNDYCFLLFHIRLQDLTDRDLEKQEREKSLNSLEAFVFETQVELVFQLLS